MSNQYGPTETVMQAEEQLDYEEDENELQTAAAAAPVASATQALRRSCKEAAEIVQDPTRDWWELPLLPHQQQGSGHKPIQLPLYSLVPFGQQVGTCLKEDVAVGEQEPKVSAVLQLLAESVVFVQQQHDKLTEGRFQQLRLTFREAERIFCCQVIYWMAGHVARPNGPFAERLNLIVEGDKPVPVSVREDSEQPFCCQHGDCSHDTADCEDLRGKTLEQIRMVLVVNPHVTCRVTWLQPAANRARSRDRAAAEQQKRQQGPQEVNSADAGRGSKRTRRSGHQVRGMLGGSYGRGRDQDQHFVGYDGRGSWDAPPPGFSQPSEGFGGMGSWGGPTPHFGGAPPGFCGPPPGFRGLPPSEPGWGQHRWGPPSPWGPPCFGPPPQAVVGVIGVQGTGPSAQADVVMSPPSEAGGIPALQPPSQPPPPPRGLQQRMGMGMSAAAMSTAGAGAVEAAAGDQLGGSAQVLRSGIKVGGGLGAAAGDLERGRGEDGWSAETSPVPEQPSAAAAAAAAGTSVVQAVVSVLSKAHADDNAYLMRENANLTRQNARLEQQLHVQQARAEAKKREVQRLLAQLDAYQRAYGILP